MKREEIEATVRNIVQDKQGLDMSELVDDASLENDLGCDSLDSVEIILEVEQAFNVAVTDDAGNAMKILKDIFDYVEQELSKKEEQETEDNI